MVGVTRVDAASVARTYFGVQLLDSHSPRTRAHPLLTGVAGFVPFEQHHDRLVDAHDEPVGDQGHRGELLTIVLDGELAPLGRPVDVEGGDAIEIARLGRHVTEVILEGEALLDPPTAIRMLMRPGTGITSASHCRRCAPVMAWLSLVCLPEPTGEPRSPARIRRNPEEWETNRTPCG